MYVSMYNYIQHTHTNTHTLTYSISHPFAPKRASSCTTICKSNTQYIPHYTQTSRSVNGTRAASADVRAAFHTDTDYTHTDERHKTNVLLPP